MRIPRKKKKKIPKGLYCYTFVKTLSNEDGSYRGYKIKPCPFYDKPIDRGGVFGRCKLLKCEVMDQCKECGLNYGKYFK